jgi:hypothetical protein
MKRTHFLKGFILGWESLKERLFPIKIGTSKGWFGLSIFSLCVLLAIAITPISED